MIRSHLAAATLFAGLAVAMTWPLAFALDRAVAYPGDPYITTWVLDWDDYAIVHQPLHLFEANTFYPAHNSLAFSENLFGIAVLLVPLRLLGMDALTAHNVALLAGFAFSGFAACLLGWMLTESWAAGIAAGIVYAFVPFRFTQIPHIQHVWGGWLPLLIVALIHYGHRPSWNRAALFGVVFFMNGLTNIHWLLFGALAIALSVPLAVPRPRDWGALLAATAVALLLLGPFLWPYVAVARLYGMERASAEALAFSAHPSDWLNPGVANRLYRRFADRSANAELWLFPGALSIVLSMGGLLLARRQKREGAIALLWVAIGVLGSFGLHTFFFRFLFDYVPGFRAVRVPARFANIAYVGLSMLVALAVAALARRRGWAAGLVSVLLIFELRAAPIRWYSSSPTVPGVYTWLRTHQARIAELPIGTDVVEYGYVRWATVHHRQTVNGSSGFLPPEYARLSAMWNAAPAVSSDLVPELRRLGVTNVIVHGDWFGKRECDWLRKELAAGRLSFAGRFSGNVRGDWLFVPGPGIASTPQLETFLAGGFTRDPGTFGLLDYPTADARVPDGSRFNGWALSPWGVARVDLLFDNGQVRVPTTLTPDAGLSRGLPFYPLVPRPRFVALIPKRPAGVRRTSDVQVEITDGRGVRTWLEDRWFKWEH